ncbi:MAG: basic amino acid ABC transporter substrate-binding protein [Cellulosilyticaceae bacterium]
MKLNKLSKIVAIVAIGVLSVGTLVGCGGKSEDVLIMGTNATFPPFEYIEGGKIVGFDVELAELIANKMGKKLQVEDMEFNTLLASVDSGKIDFVAAGMTVSEERLKQVDFSNEYFKSKQMIIVNEGDASIKAPEDLEGKKIGVQLGTTGDTYASDIKDAEVTQYDKGAIAVMDLKNKKIDAVIIDQDPAKKLAESQKGVVVVEAPFIEEEYAIAIKKGNTKLQEEINKALDEVKQDGSFDKLVEKYFAVK